MQINWEEYGIDFSSPVSLDTEEAVIVDPSPDVLSDEEKQMLQQHFFDVTAGFTEENLLQNFMITKLFVHNVF